MNARELPFDPCPLLGHPHIQTVLPPLLGVEKEPGSQSVPVVLPDGDQLITEITTPEGWKSSDLTVLCVPGFCGCHEDPAMVRLARRFSSKGIRVARFNGRGAGSGRGLAREVANLHFSQDVLAVVQKIKELNPESSITVIGYSLGGNVVLKMMGDLGSANNGLVSRVIAIAPPVDLTTNMDRCSLLFNKNWWMSFYDRYFYQEVRKKISSDSFPQKGTMPSFFQDYVAPRFGFSDAHAYFAEGSSIHTINKIEISCKILFAQDDPLVLHDLLDSHELPPHIEIYKTKKGGHLGYLGNPLKPEGFYWLDSLLVDWVLGRDVS